MIDRDKNQKVDPELNERIERLQQQFRSEFHWEDFLTQQQRFLNKNVPQEFRARAQEVFERSSQSFENVEREFADRVIAAYTRWSQEADPIVLWDIDLTMGGAPHTFYGSDQFLAQTGYSWGFRPVQLQLFSFLQREFPEVRNGILTRRPENALKSHLTDRNELGAVRSYIDIDQTYSVHSDREKLKRLDQLRSRGSNLKSVDDSYDIWQREAPAGTGLDFTGIAVEAWVCIVMGQDHCDFDDNIIHDSREAIKQRAAARIAEREHTSIAHSNFQQVQIEHQPFSGASVFDGRENFRKLMEILFECSESYGRIIRTEDADDAVVKAAHQLGSGRNLTIAECYSVGGPFEMFIEAPDSFPEQGAVGSFENLSETSYEEFGMQLPRIRLREQFDTAVEKFYSLCSKLSAAGVRFVVEMNTMEESGLQQFRTAWLREKPNNFKLD